MKYKLIPKDLMIPLGAQTMKDLGKSPDNWTDGEVSNFRAKLPSEYHVVSVDSVRRQLLSLRMAGAFRSFTPK